MELHEEVVFLSQELKRNLIKLDLILKTNYNIDYPDYKEELYSDAIFCNDDALYNTKKLLAILDNNDIFFLPN